MFKKFCIKYILINIYKDVFEYEGNDHLLSSGLVYFKEDIYDRFKEKNTLYWSQIEGKTDENKNKPVFITNNI